MTLPTIVRRTVIVSALLVPAACGLAGGRPTATTDAPAARSAAPSPVAASASPRIEPTLRPPPATDGLPPATDDLPPRGFLAGQTAVEGWLGSYCWFGSCADVPAPPRMEALPTVVAADDELEFSLSDGATFIRWRATYSADGSQEAKRLGEGGEEFDPDARPTAQPVLLSDAVFDTPPGGDWIVFVQLFFDGGDLSYAWHVTVD